MRSRPRALDLVITGKQSVDDNSGAVYAGVAAKLGWPLVSAVTKIVDVGDGKITVERMVEGAAGDDHRQPARRCSAWARRSTSPRYPSFMGIRKASKAKIPATPAGDLGVVSGSGKTQWSNIRKPEERKTECVIIDGASVEEKAAKLADALMAEKVI